ncbi:MAG: citrate lyase subunit beta [Thermoplasmata archaeon]|nr:MAG: citrate lyase subunit beta [Thermoplasmata archaeon]RLF73908.1 MAG: citrate lyase subunit beta [Thermoplasmata archaeon]HDD59799.1 citrate lyase subunit beta [Euryarchaeota archaeon]
MRLRRSRLYVPGNNPSMLVNAGVYGADVLTFDLEDSVSPGEKLAARLLVGELLKEKTVDFGRSEVTVRINPLSTPYGKKDLLEIVCERLEGIYLPKTESEEDVIKLDELLTRLEEEKGLEVGRIKLFAIIETARGVLNAYQIASASKRLEAITIGGEDLTADLGGERTPDGMTLFTARQMILLAARAAGVQALDTVYSDIKDSDGLYQEAVTVRKMGYDGKAAIHPSQIEVIHRAFTPTEEEIEYARRVIEALETAKKEGSGVAALGSKMIDRPIVKRAERILERAKAAGLLSREE